MGSFSAMHWLVVLAVVVLVFGTRRLPSAMGDIARGIKSFKRQMAEPEAPEPPEPPPPRGGEV